MPLSTTTIAGPFTLPDSNGVPLRGKFTLRYNTSDGTIREPAADKTMAGVVEYDVPASGILNWTNLISFPQAGLTPATGLTATLTFESRDKRHPVTWSATIDSLPAGTVSIDDLAANAAVPLTPELIALAGVDATIADRVNDGASATRAALNAKFSHLTDVMVNASDYGTLGGADDAATIQAALTAAAGRIVYIPRKSGGGAWTCGTINLPAGTTLTAAAGTIIKAKNGLDADLLTNTSGASDITITNLTIDGNKANQTDNVSARGIYLINSARVLIDGCHLYDVEGHGIHFSNAGTIEGQRVSNTIIRNCGSNASNTMGSGFAVTSAAGLTLSNVQVYDCAKAGFRLSGHTITLNGCVAKRNQNGGIVPVSLDNTGITVNGGFFSDNGTGTDNDGIRLVGAKNVTLNGVVCSGNYGAGVGVYNSSSNITISGGSFYNNGKHASAASGAEGRSGIVVNGASSAVTDVTIVGARCYDDQGGKTQDYGIHLAGDVDYITIDDANLRGNETSGFRNSSTTAASVILNRCQGIALSTVDNTAATVTGTTTETDLKTVTLTAGQLGRKNGFRLRAAGTLSGTAGSKVVRFKFGTTTAIAVSAAAASTSNWVVEVDCFNTATNAQNVVIKGYEGTGIDVMSYSTFAIDTTADISIGVTGTLGNTADSIVCRQFTLEPI